MTLKRKIQILLDIVMVVSLPFLMAYQLIGEAAHEWLGICMFLLFICHHILNLHWHKNLLRGKYNALRFTGTLIDVLLFVIMILLPISGMIMSEHIFVFINADSGIGIARIIHLLTSYWGLALMSVHAGFHWNMFLGMLNRYVWKSQKSTLRTWIARMLCIALCGYGCFSFLKRQIGEYMLLRSEFVFFDFGEPLVFFVLDYFAIIGMFGCVGYYISKLLKTTSKAKK